MSKIYSMLGIGKRAGYVNGGETSCIIELKRGKCYLLIIANDASENTKDKFIYLCKKYNVRYIIYGQKEHFGSAIGKEVISTITVSNRSFADSLLKLME